MKNKRKITAGVLAFLMIQFVFPAFFGLRNIASAAYESAKTIHISSSSDLIQLSKDCSVNSYSNGLTVVLDKDIDLMNVDFMPIAVFEGMFDGQGHIVKGFVLGSNGSHQGFFRYVGKNAEIKNLTVIGVVKPEGSRCQVGGLVGVNNGRIEGCSFDGTVGGLNYIGGLVGVNYGMILNCRSSGSVIGKRFTGGIAGYSEGEVNGCRNEAYVNTEITEGGIELDNLNINNFSDNFSLISAQDSDIVSDSGGIVGYSKGIVCSCENSGRVGYPHYGYNTGGIAGRQSGYLNNCTNDGAIFGRKDIGGIVGQMEPNLILKNRKVLSDEINTLTSLVSWALLDADDMSETVSGALDEMRKCTKNLLEDFTLAIPEQSWNEDTPEIFDPENPDDFESSIDEHLQSWNDNLDREKIDEDMKRLMESMENLTAWRDNLDKEKIGGDVNGLSSSMEYVSAALDDAVSLTTEDFEKVNQQANIVLSLISSALGGNMNVDVYDDESEDVSDGNTDGWVADSMNNGCVSGDTDIGGIAGAMEIEYEFDMEGTLAGAVSEYSRSGNVISSTFKSKCVSIRNVNNGSIEAKKDYSGGIVGIQNAGLIVSCQDYGNICSDGKYIGGISGMSRLIKNSYAVCTAEGSEYVGGITGLGTTVTGCAAIITIDPSTACCGGIAGYLNETDAEHVSGNTFLGENLGGIDGISYIGQAEPVDYSVYAKDSSVPEMFRSLKVVFKADGETVKEIPFLYGEGISYEEIPPVPAKKGYSGKWQDIDLSRLYCSTAVEAEYESFLSTIASERQREETDLPLLVLEGNYTGSSSVDVNSYSGEGPKLGKSDHFLEAWTADIYGSIGNDVIIRYYAPKAAKFPYSLKLYVLNDNGFWEEKEYQTFGRYIGFPSDKSSITFCTAEIRNDRMLRSIEITAVGITLLIMIKIGIRNIKKKKASQIKQLD